MSDPSADVRETAGSAATGGDNRKWHQRKRVRVPAYVVVFGTLLVAALLYGVYVKVMARAGGRDHPVEELRAVQERDGAQVLEWAASLEEASADLESIAATAPRDLTVPLGVEQTQRARQRWAEVFELSQALTARADYHRDIMLSLSKQRRREHIRAFLLCDTADLVVQHAGLRLAQSLGDAPRWERILNEANAAMGIPDGSFDSLRRDIVSPERSARQFAGRQYLKVLRLSSVFDETTASGETAALLAKAEAEHKIVEQLVENLGIGLTIQETKDITGDLAFKAWFPVQKGVANEMGNVRVIEAGKYLVSAEQIEQLRAKMEPGDVVVARKNGYLSNAGIPGFWPHAELYVGRPEELETFFDDDGVRAWCASQPEGAKDLPSLLAARFPKAWEAYTHPDPALWDLHGDEAKALPAWQNAIFEAIAEGVVFRPLEVSAHADYVGVLRPRLDKTARAQALVRAFVHQGKPYDYNFDFVTENALVCSELVYRAYEPHGSFKGLDLPLGDIMGHTAHTPNDMVKKFDLEWGSPGQELDFVGFLDAREKAGAATWGSMDDFRKTWMKPKIASVMPK